MQAIIRKPLSRGVVTLAEAIILQSLEDLWSNEFREESECFFNGEGFQICAEIAGINAGEESLNLNLYRRNTIGKTVRKDFN